MSNIARFAPSLIRLIFLPAVLSLALLAWGCASAFTDDPYETISVPTERFEQIDALDLAAMSAEPDADEIAEPNALPAELNLSIEDCRAAALQNNLGLKVQLFIPSMAQQGVNEQIAAFEPLAFSQFAFSKTDTPTSATLDASQQETAGGDLGVDIPLLTGGRITLDQSFWRTQTDNIFSTLNPAYTTDMSMTLRQPLLRGGGIQTNTHGIRIARYDSQIGQARTKLEVIRVIAAVDIAYWRLYAARQELLVRKQEHDLAVAQRQRAERRVAAGKTAQIEILRAETGVAERLEGIITAENRVRDHQRGLKRIMNRPDLDLRSSTIPVPTTDPNPLRYILDTDKLLEYALQQRMELLEVQLQIAKDASRIEFQQNNALPFLALDYTYNINGLGESGSESYDLLLENRFVDHHVGVSLQVPLGNLAARSRLRRAVLQRRQDLATRQQREIIIEQEVLNAVDQLEANWQRILAGRTRTVLAGRNLEAEQRQFEQGLQTSTEVLDAQARFADAQTAELRALVEYQIAQVDLAFATGTLVQAARVQWEPSGENIDAE